MMTNGTIPIAFDDVGDGDSALLCLPGWCASRSVFRPMYDDLAKSHRVLALDWRGHGGSASTPTDFGVEELVSDALAVVESSRVKRFVPVATAHAGWVAIELRKRLGPEKVPAIVLLDWMVTGAPPGFLDGLRALTDEASWSAVRASLFQRWTTGVANPAVHAFVQEMGKHGFEMWSRAGREIGAAFTKHGSPLALLECIAPPCPTLHLYAQPDDPRFLAAQRSYAESHPWFQVEKLEAASHFPTLEAPSETARHIASALRAYAHATP
jgi:pimeloyl-ACP methyl ester carboxylesterase